MAKVSIIAEEWDNPTMKSAFGKEVKRKLETYYRRPMFGTINMGGVKVKYADPDAVIELINKIKRLEEEKASNEAYAKKNLKLIQGFSVD